MTNRPCSFTAVLTLASLVCLTFVGGVGEAVSPTQTAQEQRIDIVIRNSVFELTPPGRMQPGLPTVIVLRNQDIIRHGFTSTMLVGLLVRGEGEGIAAYGKGVEGFYVDPGKMLVIRFTNERPGSYAFRCDLHPQMKGELFMMEVPTA